MKCVWDTMGMRRMCVTHHKLESIGGKCIDGIMADLNAQFAEHQEIEESLSAEIISLTLRLGESKRECDNLAAQLTAAKEKLQQYETGEDQNEPTDKLHSGAL